MKRARKIVDPIELPPAIKHIAGASKNSQPPAQASPPVPEKHKHDRKKKQDEFVAVKEQTGLRIKCLCTGTIIHGRKWHNVTQLIAPPFDTMRRLLLNLPPFPDF